MHQLAPFVHSCRFSSGSELELELDWTGVIIAHGRGDTLSCATVVVCVSGGRISAEQREAADTQDSQCTTAMKTLLYV